MRKEDNLWKGILDDVFTDFIRFIHPGVDEILDLERGVEFLDKELAQVFPAVNGNFSPKLVDKLVKVYTKDGDEEWILLHIEVQAKYSKDFGKRMFTYFYRLFDKYNKRISAYAIFTEASVIQRPDNFRMEFMGTKLDYRFNTYKLAAPTTEELLANENPFAIVVLAARTALAGRHIKNKKDRDEFIKELKIGLIKELYRRNIENRKKTILLNFLLFYINFDLKETIINFEKELDSLNNTKTTMGVKEQILEMFREELIKQGIKLGKDQLKEQLVHKFMTKLDYTDQQIAELIEVPITFINRIRKQKAIKNPKMKAVVSQ